MRIDNNYTQYRQPNFGRLKSIQYGKNYYPDVYPEETARLLRTIKESKAFNEFFKQYDADLFINKGKHELYQQNTDFVKMTLKTAVPKTDGGNWYPELVLEAEASEKEACPTQYLINRLTRKIEDIEFLDLKYWIDGKIKELEKEEKNKNLDEIYKAEIEDITNSLLSSEKPKKKTFFEKLFGRSK